MLCPKMGVTVLITAGLVQIAKITGLPGGKRAAADAQDHRNRFMRGHLGAVVQGHANPGGIQRAEDLRLAFGNTPANHPRAEWDTGE